MLVQTKEVLSNFNPPALLEESEDNSCTQEYSNGYLKYGLYSRRTIFFHAFYKAYNLELFKADVNNARILSSILSKLLQYFIPSPQEWTIITTPKRAHTEKLGYHFASEVLKNTADEIGVNFLENVIGAKDKNKISPQFFQLKPVPNTRLIIFDDILTTGKTIYATLDVLKSNPRNNMSNYNPPVIIGINNN